MTARSVPTTGGLLPPVLHAAAISLTVGQHDGRVVTLNPGASLTIDWSKTGNGFVCVVLNRSGADLTPTLVGFSAGTITTTSALTKLLNGGMAALLVHSPDGGTTKVAAVAGDLAA